MGISNRGNILLKVFILSLAASCVQPKRHFPEKETFGSYESIFKLAEDSLENWRNQDLKFFGKSYNQNFAIDSTFLFNSIGDRFISAVFQWTNERQFSDDVLLLLGEKINNKWYFFFSDTYVLPRVHYKGNDELPFTYSEFQHLARKEVYIGYILRGEEFFTSHFEGSGWGTLETQEYQDWCLKGKRYTDLNEYYKAVHICAAKSIWRDRDTSKPIVPLTKMIP